MSEFQNSGAGSPGRKLVLVVEDEAMVRMLAVDLFEEIGCEVIEAGTGADALDKLEAHPDVSLMFTDCRMPGMSGPELAEIAAKRWPHLRIVLVTGYHNMKAPGWPIVWKPYDARRSSASSTGNPSRPRPSSACPAPRALSPRAPRS